MKRVLIFCLCLACLGFLFVDKSNTIPEGAVIDKIIVIKSKHILEVYAKNKLLKTYKIAYGRGGDGPKEYEGDRKTPEGIYTITGKNKDSGYHNNLGISYPNDLDRARCKKWNKPTGGDIKIHGLKNGFGFIGSLHRLFDWTLGCIALTNAEVDELSEHTPIGTIIEIKH